jgi:hypothetical protein
MGDRHSGPRARVRRRRQTEYVSREHHHPADPGSETPARPRADRPRVKRASDIETEPVRGAGAADHPRHLASQSWIMGRPCRPALVDGQSQPGRPASVIFLARPGSHIAGRSQLVAHAFGYPDAILIARDRARGAAHFLSMGKPEKVGLDLIPATDIEPGPNRVRRRCQPWRHWCDQRKSTGASGRGLYAMPGFEVRRRLGIRAGCGARVNLPGPGPLRPSPESVLRGRRL